MKNLIYIILILSLFSCSTKEEEEVIDEEITIVNDVKPKNNLDTLIKLKCDRQMYYNPSLANKLDFIVDNLKKNRFNYTWMDHTDCNVGLVAKILLDIKSQKVYKDKVNYYWGPLAKIEKEYNEEGKYFGPEGLTWQYMTNYYCPVGEMYLPDIFFFLSKEGLAPEEIGDLEYLKNPCILKNTNINIHVSKYYTSKENLIKYLESWIIILRDKNNPSYTNIYKLKKIIKQNKMLNQSAQALAVPENYIDTLNIE